MDPITLVILLLAAAVVLIAIEMFLPTHGALGGAGAVAASGAIAVAFLINRWAGVALLGACVVAAPFIVLAMLNVWERSRLGRRLRLSTTPGSLTHEKIEVGDVGTTLTELRPMGRAEFGPIGVDVISQRGQIAAGTSVRVIDYTDGVATVAALHTEGTHS
jgi:membrane-bound serine protease (ClpP class)